jgi:hypothetical protein
MDGRRQRKEAAEAAQRRCAQRCLVCVPATAAFLLPIILASYVLVSAFNVPVAELPQQLDPATGQLGPNPAYVAGQNDYTARLEIVCDDANIANYLVDELGRQQWPAETLCGCAWPSPSNPDFPSKVVHGGSSSSTTNNLAIVGLVFAALGALVWLVLILGTADDPNSHTSRLLGMDESDPRSGVRGAALLAFPLLSGLCLLAALLPSIATDGALCTPLVCSFNSWFTPVSGSFSALSAYADASSVQSSTVTNATEIQWILRAASVCQGVSYAADIEDAGYSFAIQNAYVYSPAAQAALGSQRAALSAWAATDLVLLVVTAAALLLPSRTPALACWGACWCRSSCCARPIAQGSPPQDTAGLPAPAAPPRAGRAPPAGPDPASQGVRAAGAARVTPVPDDEANGAEALGLGAIGPSPPPPSLARSYASPPGGAWPLQ